MHREPLDLKFDHEALIVNGVSISWLAVPELLAVFGKPDERKWYRIERMGNEVMVHAKIEDVTGPHKVCACGYNTKDRLFRFCPFDGNELDLKSIKLEVDDGRPITRSVEDSGRQGEETQSA